MNKSITSLTAALFVLGAALQAGAEQGKSTQVTRSNISNNKAAAPTECAATADGGDCDDAAQVNSPRDAASGQATGKRQHKPVTVIKETDKSATVDADGDGAASGQAKHKPFAKGTLTNPQLASGQATADADGDGAAEVSHEVKSPRDAASGQATGKRQHKPIRTTTADVDGDGAAEVSHEVKSPRDVASGQATGKRVATGDVNGDGTADAATQDHNSSRSNKTASAVEPDGDGTPEAQGMAINEKGLPGGSTKAKAGKTGSAK